jgi:hypothetical protein
VAGWTWLGLAALAGALGGGAIVVVAGALVFLHKTAAVAEVTRPGDGVTRVEVSYTGAASDVDAAKAVRDAGGSPKADTQEPQKVASCHAEAAVNCRRLCRRVQPCKLRLAMLPCKLQRWGFESARPSFLVADTLPSQTPPCAAQTPPPFCHLQKRQKKKRQRHPKLSNHLNGLLSKVALDDASEGDASASEVCTLQMWFPLPVKTGFECPILHVK